MESQYRGIARLYPFVEVALQLARVAVILDHVAIRVENYRGSIEWDESRSIAVMNI